jgi:putative transposase
MDDTYIKVAGQWKYLYRAVDKSGANTAAVRDDACLDIELRQSKYLNNITEQDHRAIKRIAKPMLGFKSFWIAGKLITSMEIQPLKLPSDALCT